MCIIIIKDNKKKRVSNDILAISAVINPHGLGVVWLDNFKVEYFNSSDYDVLNVSRPYIAHFRYATVGGDGDNGRHPFLIRNGCYLFQNGTNYNLGCKDESDTAHLAKILSKCESSVWMQLLEMTDSRYVVVDTITKKYAIANKEMFINRKGILYSKSNVLDKTLMAVYGTLKKGGSNYFSYLSRETFIGSGQTLNKYPLIINGLPYLMSKKGVGHNVDVDLFAVSNKALESIDLLESHPNWYKRERTDIVVDGVVFKAWIYFNDDVFDNKVYHKSFKIKKSNFSRSGDDFDFYYPTVDKSYKSSYNGLKSTLFDDYDDEAINSKKYAPYEASSCAKCGGYDCYYDEYEQGVYCFHCQSYTYDNGAMY